METTPKTTLTTTCWCGQRRLRGSSKQWNNYRSNISFCMYVCACLYPCCVYAYKHCVYHEHALVSSYAMHCTTNTREEEQEGGRDKGQVGVTYIIIVLNYNARYTNFLTMHAAGGSRMHLSVKCNIQIHMYEHMQYSP